ncbi:MAG: ABC transporter permease [Thermoleophilia bacterium]|nr:ABC transporter permease [Thermoleophilia bacterium]
MRRFIVKRLILAVITLLGVSLIVFVAARLTGDPVLLFAPTTATEEQLDELRAKMGLDKPIPVQFLIFLRDAVRGDFGISLRYSQPAMTLALKRLGPTLELAAYAFILGLLGGVFLGITSATRPGSIRERAGTTFAMLGLSVPGFWLAVILMLVFAVHLHWFPTSGREGALSRVLPTVSVAWVAVAQIMRVTRSAMLEVLGSDYMKMARIKGLKERVVIWKHALRNALVPVLGIAGFLVAMLIGGLALVESVFRWPGIGSLLIEAVFARDFPLVQAGVLLVSAVVILINLAVDLLYGVVDPRIRYE